MEKIDDLIKSAFDGDLETVKKLVGSGVNVNGYSKKSDNAPLHAAIENEQIEIVQYLLLKGADTELIVWDLTPLQHAVDIAIDGTIQSGALPGEEPTELIDILLNAGADINGVSDKGESSLDIADQYKFEKIKTYLTERGAARTLSTFD